MSKRGQIAGGEKGGHQVEKSRYVLDNKILSKPLKERINSYRRRPFLLKENSTAAFTGLPPISSTG